MIWLNKQKFFRRYLPMLLSVILLATGVGAYLILHKSTPKADASWFSSSAGSWNYRQKIVIDHTKVSIASSTTLSNFPVLINTTNVLFKSTANGGHVTSAVGNDILFTDSTGTVNLNHEIEKYASTTGELEAWVNIPSLSPTVDTSIYMYYGGPSATSQQNSTGVWDSNYKGVWHLAQGGSATSTDSTSNALNGTNTGTTATTTGQIDGATGGFNGSSSKIQTANSNFITAQNQVHSVSAWVFPTSEAADQGIWSFGEVSDNQNTTGITINSSGHLGWSGNGGTSIDSGLPVPLNQWSFVSMVRTSTTFIFRVNSSTATVTDASSATIGNGNPQQIGLTCRTNCSLTEYFTGSIDEVEVSNTNRSLDWIVTEYNNQNSPSTFHTFVGEESRLQAQVNGGWYNASWLYRKKITINHEQVSGTSTLANFPVLVSFTDPLMKYTGSGGHVASSTGGDILFTNSSGVLLNFEREYYASTTGQLISWVQVPTLSPTADTVIYAYYGNASATDLQNKTGTWDSNYVGVWHLPDGSNLSGVDSTNNNNGSLVNSPAATSGQIDGAGNFVAASSQAINLGTGATLNFTGTQTAEGWVNLTTNSSAFGQTLVGMASSGGFPGEGISIILGRTNACGSVTVGAGKVAVLWENTCIVGSSATFSTGSWHHVAVIRSGSSGNWTAMLYVDGALDSQATGITTNPSVAHDFQYSIGVDGADTSCASCYLNGKADEVRLSNSARTASWVATEYNNQNSPSTFTTVAGEETQSATTFNSTWYSTAWTYRKPIVIDHNKVNQATGTTTPLTNFPVLVSLTDADLKNNASSTGADIFFTSSDGLTKLNYERELYASSTGQLVAWVQVPSLSSTADNVIYMYFGNSAASDQQSASGTWDSTFGGVWHLPDGTNLNPNDSTGNAINGSVTGATATSGQIDGAAAFSGSGQYINIPDNSALKPTSAISFGAWFKVASTTQTNQAVMSKTEGGGYSLYVNGNSTYFNGCSGTLCALVRYNGSTYAVATTTISNFAVNTWYYALVTYDGSNEKLYVNGQLLTTTAASGSVNNSITPLCLSAESHTGTSCTGDSVTGNFNGTIDEARVSNSARTSDWINTEYLNQATPSTFYAVGGLQAQNRSSSKGGVGVSNRGSVATSWYDANWSYRQPFIIDHSLVNTATGTTTPLTNFPVVISLTSSNLKYTGSSGNVASSSGADILFTSSDGITKIPYEREFYSSSTGQLIAWVNVPSVSSQTDTTIYMYYGNSTAGLADQQQASSVWDSNYKFVAHYPNGTTLSTTDSTGNQSGSTFGGATFGTGELDGGLLNNASGARSGVNYGTGTGLDPGSGDFTVSIWVNKTANSSGFSNLWVFTKWNSGNSPGTNEWIVGAAGGGSGNTNQFGFSVESGNTTYATTDPTTHSLSTWYQVTGVRSGTLLSLYKNGAVVATTTLPSNTTINTPGRNMKVGDADIAGGGTNFSVNGTFDEARYSSTARSADWIKTEYNNQNSPSTFAVAGSQQGKPGYALSDGTWLFRKTITISHSLVSSVNQTTLSNFPVLISVNGASGIIDTDFKTIANGGRMGRTDGLDMKFTLPTGYVLPYELEKYSSSTGETIAWVQLPTLSPTTDTQIYVYLGNASASDQSNKAAVWDSNYKGVWHLADAGTSTSTDSTSNINNGTNNTLLSATGQLDGAGSFNGTSSYVDAGNGASTQPASVITLSAWVNFSSTADVGEAILSHGDNSYAMYLHKSGANYFLCWAKPKVANSGCPIGAAQVTAGAWHYVTAVNNIGTNVLLYVDGSLVASPAFTNTYTFTKNFRIGASDSEGLFFNGTIDEARLSSTGRTSDWIKTEYNNQNSPSTFYTITGANTAVRAANIPLLKSRGGVKFH